MSDLLSFSVLRVLAAAWQQRRNTASAWGLAAVLCLCSVFPIGLFAWSLVSGPEMVPALRHGAAVSGWIGAGALVTACWTMLVGNLLQQNHPALARLVPGHVEHLRGALLAAWAVLVIVAAAGPGLAFGAPLAWACATAAALPLLTLSLRWPLLWLTGFVAPYLMSRLTAWSQRDAFLDALQALWQRDGWVILGGVVAVGAMLLASVIQSGGSRHVAVFESRRRLVRRFRAGGADIVSGDGAVAGLRGFQSLNGRPYAAWLRRQLARPDSPVTSRLLLGLGPTLHWTSRVVAIGWTIVAGAAAILLPNLLLDGGPGAMTIVWSAPAALLGIGTLGLATHSLLHRTRREQALLALLPGVPGGAALNRWLGLQMSLQFLMTVGVALLLSRGLFDLAEVLQPGLARGVIGSTTEVLGAALLPLLPWQWRRWASLREPSALDNFMPLIAALGLAVLALLLGAVTGVGYMAVGAAFCVAALLRCAWRWWRMGTEPSAFPVGRLA